MLTYMGQKAQTAARILACAPTAQRDAVLKDIADRLIAARSDILAANERDVEAGAANLTEAMIDRLLLNEKRLGAMAADLRHVAELPDPVGEAFEQRTLPNGLQLRKQRVPLGVLGVIYESRPNVTIDIAGLALKSGNAVILRGGSETICSNKALVEVIGQSLRATGLPPDAVQFVDSPDRTLVLALLRLVKYVDLIIPRGGAALHNFCRQNSRIPVITGGVGICHLYVDDSADPGKALDVIRNAKIQKPSACNALDTVLVHRAIAPVFLPMLVSCLSGDGVVFKAHESAASLLRNGGQDLPLSITAAAPDDFDTEWLSLVLGLKVVLSLDEAIAHVNAHSQGHSDGILTASRRNAEHFVAEVDSAAVYVNASTRFTDGAQFGLGAEVAISTQRLHARGPMGLRELMTYKWIATGDYHVRL
jgi:glutamate-5-semialdehyde dehydrogenase